jgi:phenylpropionate dioxygenase-like ring-hydroxylating dioxygenase large terminal subunit
MPNALQPGPGSSSPPSWIGDLTRVPFWVYRDEALPKVEQDRIFEGPVWNYLCLEDEIANPGDWRTTVVGRMPVVVARDGDGSIAAFENRCAHRGALICLDNAGKGTKDFQCVYHAWRYDLRGNLQSVAFQRGVKGKGGMPPDFKLVVRTRQMTPIFSSSSPSRRRGPRASCAASVAPGCPLSRA